MLDVSVIGPGPFSPGGVGVMAGYLSSTSSQRTRLRFDESGGAPGGRLGRALCFLTVAAQCGIGPDHDRVRFLNVAPNGSTWRKVLLSWLLQLRGRPYVVHLHGGAYDTWVASRPAVLRWATRSMFTGADRVAVLGQVWSSFVQEGLGVEASRVALLPNCVPGPDQVPPRRMPLRILLAGQVGARKGAPELLEAWSGIVRRDGARLVLAGDLRDPDGTIADSIARSEGVELLGWLGPEEITQQMAAAHILVLPSHGENLPLSVLEGMAWGLAQVVTPVGAVPEAVRDGVEGYVVPVGSVEELRDRLQRLIDDPAARDRIGEAGRARWEESFALERYRPMFDDVAEAAAASARQRRASRSRSWGIRGAIRRAQSGRLAGGGLS